MMTLFIRMAGNFGIKEKEAERFFKFLVVGTIGFIVDFGTLTLLKETTDMSTLVANTISFTLAVISNFTFNRYWTYPDSRSKRLRSQLGQFFIVSLIGLTINDLLMVFLEGPFDNLLHDLGVTAVAGYIPAKMVATVVVLFWNFFVNRFWTYGDVD
jgi:putative flippase GtrA